MEYLLNHLDLCALIYNGQTNQAITLFTQQYNTYIKDTCINHCKIYLSTLNQSIYNYILIKEKVSLHKCCLKNMEVINTCYQTSEIERLGKQIIESYCFCIDYRIESHTNEHIKKALTYIHQQLGEPLTLETLCTHINMNPCYFSSLFKKCTNCSFKDYLTTERIKMAKKLLVESKLPLEHIANQCGFNSYSYFCTLFKKHTGHSPSQFRQMAS